MKACNGFLMTQTDRWPWKIYVGI